MPNRSTSSSPCRCFCKIPSRLETALSNGIAVISASSEFAARIVQAHSLIYDYVYFSRSLCYFWFRLWMMEEFLATFFPLTFRWPNSVRAVRVGRRSLLFIHFEDFI